MVPGDKSISHRALILSGLAEGSSTITGLSNGDDVRNTALAMQSLGVRMDEVGAGVLIVEGGQGLLHEPDAPLFMGNSGTGMRLMAGVLASFPWWSVLYGDASLSRRPMDRVALPLSMMGAKIEGRGSSCLPPLGVRGTQLKGIDYEPPVASAQVKSAVLLAALRASGRSILRERLVTRTHTEELLSMFGADIEVHDGPDGHRVVLNPSPLVSCEVVIPGDPSQAAFWIVAGCIVPDSEVLTSHVYSGPARLGFLDVLVRMGADIDVHVIGDHLVNVRARYGGLRGIELEASEVPGVIDEIPILAVAAAVAEGRTVMHGLGELRVKESDRLSAVVSMLSALGARIEGTGQQLVVEGGARLRGGRVDSKGDHRIAMAAAIAALATERGRGEVAIDGFDSVDTSYPGFIDDLRRVSRGRCSVELLLDDSQQES